ncbi:nitronate monooxygenase family protein [Nonomuraea wenchangensis]|uniref:NAD(P)H-dependent flavin oxidoreductase n=1 Tax=Nonomuraea wenchangensis TaxID=568860 RepID=UPI003439BBA7
MSETVTAPRPRLKTRLTELLGVEHPVMLAGMGGVSYSELVAAVSEAGGFGTLGASSMRPEKLELEAGRVRRLTDRPFGVNAITAVPEDVRRLLSVIIGSGASVYVAGLGVPEEVLAELHQHGILVGALCGKTKHAERAVEAGVDFVVATGTEGGGHTGSVATLALIPAVVDAVGSRVPVVAAGGIADGRGLAAALALGADGVWIGTRFAASVEARRLKGFQDAILAARDDSTVITRAYSGKTMRVIRNAWTDHYERHPEELLPFPQQRKLAISSGVSHLGAADDSAVDPDREAYLCGQGAVLIDRILPARDIVVSMVEEAAAILTGLSGRMTKDD